MRKRPLDAAVFMSCAALVMPFERCQTIAMNNRVPSETLNQLSVAERLQLIEDVWTSLTISPEKLAVPKWHSDELDQRILAHDHEPATARSWSDVRAEILASLRNT